ARSPQSAGCRPRRGPAQRGGCQRAARTKESADRSRGTAAHPGHEFDLGRGNRGDAPAASGARQHLQPSRHSGELLLELIHAASIACAFRSTPSFFCSAWKIAAKFSMLGLPFSDSIRCRLLLGLSISAAKLSNPIVALTRSRNRRRAV